MPTRLTIKKKKEIVKRMDDIIMTHRMKMYLQLTQTLDRANVSEIRFQIGQMNAHLVEEILPMLGDLVKGQEPVLPLWK